MQFNSNLLVLYSSCLYFVTAYTKWIHNFLGILLHHWLFSSYLEQKWPAILTCVYPWIFVWYLPTCLKSKFFSAECERNTICAKAEKDSRYFHFFSNFSSIKSIAAENATRLILWFFFLFGWAGVLRNNFRMKINICLAPHQQAQWVKEKQT